MSKSLFGTSMTHLMCHYYDLANVLSGYHRNGLKFLCESSVYLYLVKEQEISQEKERDPEKCLA